MLKKTRGPLEEALAQGGATEPAPQMGLFSDLPARRQSMRKGVGIGVAGLLVVAIAVFTGWLSRVGAQGGGTIEAEVKFGGPPQVETVKVNKDVEQCGQEKKIEKIAVGPNKGVENAVLSLADGKGAPTAKAAKKPAIDQKGCEFHPHVLGMLPGEVDILNSDGILHNIHTFSTANPTINKAQPKFKKVMTQKFEKPEVIRIQCDVHSWMQGWIVVMPHPFFGITDDKGVARIENVPAGKQTIEVWHPVLGKQKKEVEVKAGQVTKVAFELKK